MTRFLWERLRVKYEIRSNHIYSSPHILLAWCYWGPLGHINGLISDGVNWNSVPMDPIAYVQDVIVE